MGMAVTWSRTRREIIAENEALRTDLEAVTVALVGCRGWDRGSYHLRRKALARPGVKALLERVKDE